MTHVMILQIPIQKKWDASCKTRVHFKIQIERLHVNHLFVNGLNRHVTLEKYAMIFFNGTWSKNLSCYTCCSMPFEYHFNINTKQKSQCLLVHSYLDRLMCGFSDLFYTLQRVTLRDLVILCVFVFNLRLSQTHIFQKVNSSNFQDQANWMPISKLQN